QVAVVVANDRPKALKPGAPECGILYEQEIPAPETLARDSSIRLRVDGEKDTRRIGRLRHPSRENQNMSERVDVYGPRPQRLLRQRDRVVVGVVVARQRSAGSGMDGVSGGPQVPSERCCKPRPLH